MHKKNLHFVTANQSLFFATTRERVDSYFKENNISKFANKAMWVKIFILLAAFLFFFILILSNQFSIWVMACFAALVGVFSALIGFNICHDAIHGALSADKRINEIFSILFNFIGASPYIWSITHNIVHHSFTNIPGHDEDIDIAPGLIRISELEKVRKVHCYQHFYAFLLYGLTSLNWVLRKDYIKFYKKKIGQHPNTRHHKNAYFNLYFYKVIYYFIFIGLPLLILHIIWWQFIIGFLIMHFVEGWILSLVFQVTHVVEQTAFPLPDTEGNMKEAWAEHQMRTSSNFSPQTPLANFFCGGLNFQTVHHLFPKICHIHYPEISIIVKQTAKEFNLPYIEYPSFLSALKSHYKMLKKLGKEAYKI